jgi:hypothetical protein
MNIFFTAAYHGKEQYQYAYDAIFNALKASTARIISPEDGSYFNLITQDDHLKNETPKHIHYEAIRRGITWADAVVFEISHESFQIGHEMTLAIQAKKHVLCLSLHENFERKIFSPYFHGARYTIEAVPQLVTDFLAICQKEQHPNRFNFFLSNSQLRFIEKKAKSLNVSASEYLRELIDNQRSPT